jgi:hypothetical protein
MAERETKATQKAEKRAENRKIDEQVEESFPASDPPAFMGGDTIGAPVKRETPAPEAEKPKK